MLLDATKELIFNHDLQVQIPAGGVTLQGCLHVPVMADILVIVIRNRDSDLHHESHFNVHDRYIRRVLNGHNIGTLCIDLLTPEEYQHKNLHEIQCDTLMLAGRLDRIAEWIRLQPAFQGARIAYLCSNTGSAAAMITAAQHPDYADALVCYGGRPDLAGAFLPKVKVPALLLVGENDQFTIELNRRSLAQLNKESKLNIILDATHLFEEPGALEEMMRHALAWFTKQASTPSKASETFFA